MHKITRRRFLAGSAGLALAPLLGCRTNAEAPASDLTFYGPTFDAFATALYGKLRSEAGNIFISPYSISTALAMTAEGAKGTTLDQMRKVLGLPADQGISDALAAAAKTARAGKDHGYELAVANSLWPQQGESWNQDFLNRVIKSFQASVTPTDFKGNAEAARNTINAWVEKQTRDKIKELFPSGSITALTRMVLANAIYFKGDWLTAFNKTLTKDAPFTKLDGSKKDVPLMYRKARIDYFADDNVKAIRLPYKGKEVSFIAVLPKDPDKFNDLDAKFTAESLSKWNKGFKPVSELDLWLPRYKVESQYTLNDTLIALGMSDAFQQGVANFSGMKADGSNDLFISLVVHKAYVDLNEEGTEAAAATGVAMTRAAAPVGERPSFRADRPFFFALRHDPSNTLLFLGRYTTP